MKVSLIYNPSESEMNQDTDNATWIENAMDIVCSKCNAKFSDEIFFMGKIKHCPGCGRKIKYMEAE